MKKLITQEMFRNDISAPFYFCKLEKGLLTSRSTAHRDIIEKWIDENIIGEWWYTDHDRLFIFQKQEDVVLFSMHYKMGIFDAENGAIEHVSENWIENLTQDSEP